MSSTSRPLFRMAAAVAGAVPVIFGLIRAVAAVAAGTACAAGAAMALGGTAGPGLAIVALGFGLCSGTSAVLSRLSNVSQPPR